MTEPNSSALMISLLFFSIVGGSLYFWMKPASRNPLRFGCNDQKLHPWALSWTDFGIFIFIIFLSILAAQSFVSPLLPENADLEPDLLDPKIAFLSILSLHLPVLLAFSLFRKYYTSAPPLKLSTVPSKVSDDLKQAFTTFIQILPVIWISALLWNLILSILQSLSLIDEFPIQPIVELLAQDISITQFLLLGLLAIVLAPITEEILFRGCLYRFLKGKFPLLLAQLSTAFLFALVHNNLNSFLPLVLIGFVLVRIYESSGSIRQAMFFHAFFNASSFLFLCLMKYSGLLLE